MESSSHVVFNNAVAWQFTAPAGEGIVQCHCYGVELFNSKKMDILVRSVIKKGLLQFGSCFSGKYFIPVYFIVEFSDF